MRTTAPASTFFRTTVVILGASLWAPASLPVEIDLDALLGEYCEENEGMEGKGGQIASSFQAPILESCRGPHRYRDAVWAVSSTLAVPAAAAEGFLHGSLLLEEAEEGTGEETAAKIEGIEKLFRRAWSDSPDNTVLRDRLLVFYMEQIDTGDFASRLVEMVQNDPDPSALALHLADGAEREDNGLAIALAAALEKAPRNAELLGKLAKASSSHALRAASYLGALGRIRLDGSKPDPEREAILAGNWLATLLDAGLAESALLAFDGLSAEIREAILDGRDAPLDTRFLFFPEAASPEVLLRSLCLAGSLEEQDVDEVGSGRLDAGPERAAPLDAELCVTLRDDPYTERMVAPAGDDPFPLIQEVDYYSGVTSGRVAPKVWLRALIDWLVREEYPEAALDWSPLLLAQIESDLHDEPPALVLELLPSDVRDDYHQVRQEIQGLSDAMRRRDDEIKGRARDGARAMVSMLAGPSPVPADLAADLISRSLGRARVLTFDRKPVPPGSDPDGEAFGDLLTGKTDAWMSRYHFPGNFWPGQVQQGGMRVVAAGWHASGLSNGPYGPRYVLIGSDDGGSTWSGPIETGLPLGPDLRVYPAALLPPVSEGTLQVEVLVRGDTADGNAQPATSLLSLPLTVLERDGDGDGLTDPLEERLMTDPESPDTDGDGLDDAEDPLPLIRLAPTDEPSELEAFLAELVPLVCDTVPSTFLDARMTRETWTRVPKDDRGRLDQACGLVFERAAFRSMMPGKRLLIVTREEAERARLKFGGFEPVSFVTFFMDRGRNRALLKWTRGLFQQTTLIVRSKGGWRVEPQ